MRAIDAGEPSDEAAYERCLRDSVRDVVRRQVDDAWRTCRSRSARAPDSLLTPSQPCPSEAYWAGGAIACIAAR
jgi:hypothetical protein